ncbi:hypothetical protein HanIR_Chr07g0326921 [Helianthus annuus]|nr:hypothetical protein HanIR_Chr07g0326921 [Helianthus annuus]
MKSQATYIYSVIVKPFVIQTHNHIFIIIFCLQIVLDSSQILYIRFRLRIPEVCFWIRLCLVMMITE